MAKRLAEEQWVTLEEAAALLELPWATLYGWARDGDPRLPGYKVWDAGAGNKDQGRFRFKKEDVEALVALTRPPEPEAVPA
jgi:predicted site-specific integrase-resolvase